MRLTVRLLLLFQGSTEIKRRSLPSAGRVCSAALVGLTLPGRWARQTFLFTLPAFLLFALAYLLITWAPAAGQSPTTRLLSATSNQNGPLLQIISPAPVTTGQVITVALNFQNDGFNIVATSFSLDLDQSCLAFDPTDQNKDGRPDAIVLHTPAGMSAAAVVDLQDSDSEFDFLIADYFPPFITLPDRTPLIEIRVRTICQPAAGTTRSVPFAFATDPTPSFGSVSGVSVPGMAMNGVVTILGPAATATPTATPTTTATTTPIVTPISTATATLMPTGTVTSAPPTPPTITPTPALVPTTFPTTLVDHFIATDTSVGIHLAWQTHSEATTVGFYVYRKRIDLQSSSFDFQALTPLVPGQGSAGGHYGVLDEQVEPAARYLYLLVEEKANGEHLAYVDLLALVTLTGQAPHQVWLPLIRR